MKKISAILAVALFSIGATAQTSPWTEKTSLSTLKERPWTIIQ